MIGLTKRQSEVLLFIADFQHKYGLSPTYQEICDGLRMKSKGGLHSVIACIKTRGLLKRHQLGFARQLELTNRGKAAIGLSEWQPMDTSPTDGSWFYVWVDFGGARYTDRVSWINGRYEPMDLNYCYEPGNILRGWKPSEVWPDPPSIDEVPE